MFAKQLTVFIENRTGRLSEVLNVLKESNVNILSLSLADTTEYGLLRLIVDNAPLGKEKLSEKGFSSLLSNVSIIKILTLIAEKNVSIEYMYGLSIEADEAYIVLKASDANRVDEILSDNGIETISCDMLSKM